jgi:hypothetical protein
VVKKLLSGRCRTVQLAARLIEDDESTGLAIAECRDWSVLTGDTQGRRIDTELDGAVLSTTEVLNQWCETPRKKRRR